MSKRKKEKLLILTASVMVLALVIISHIYSDFQINSLKKDDREIITILSGQKGTEELYYEAICRRFPEYKIQYISTDWGTDFRQRLRECINTQNYPDIIIGKAQDVENLYNEGIIAPIDKANDENAYSESINKSFYKNGELYAVSVDAIYQGVIYNKDIFDKYNIEVPKTHSEMQAAAEKLDEKGISPFMSDFDTNWIAANTFMQIAFNNVFIDEPDWGERFSASEVSFENSDKMKTAVEQLKFIDKNTYKSQNEKYSLIRGNAAMTVSGSWLIAELMDKSPDLRLGVFPYPNDEGNSKMIFEANTTFMKCSKGKHSREAEMIIKYVVSDETLNAVLCEENSNITSLENISMRNKNILYDDISKYIKSGEVIDANIYNNSILWDFQCVYAEKIPMYLNGSISAEEFLKYADENRQANIDGFES